MPPRVQFIAEGTDGEHVCGHLLLKHGLVTEFEFKVMRGVDALLSALPTLLKAALLMRGYAEADLSVLSATGVIPADRARNLPSVRCWLMPNNQSPGMLEHLLLNCIRESDRVMFGLAEEAVKSIPKEQRRFIATDEPKAIAHTWLAWQKEPGLPLGAGVKAQYFDHQAPLAVEFVGWVRQLLELSDR